MSQNRNTKICDVPYFTRSGPDGTVFIYISMETYTCFWADLVQIVLNGSHLLLKFTSSAWCTTLMVTVETQPNWFSRLVALRPFACSTPTVHLAVSLRSDFLQSAEPQKKNSTRIDLQHTARRQIYAFLVYASNTYLPENLRWKSWSFPIRWFVHLNSFRETLGSAR